MATDKQKELALKFFEKEFGARGEVEEIQRPTIWKPDKKGDAVAGFIDSVVDGELEGKAVKNIIIRTGKVFLQLPVHKLLTNLLGKADIGDGVYIVYKGEVSGKAGRKYKDYDVTVMHNPKKPPF